MEKAHRKYLPVLFYALSFAVIYVLVVPLRPMADDWYYTTSPNPQFLLADLLPGTAFWRPFDALFGGLIGLAPWMFPWLNRLVVVLAHVMNAWLAKRIAQMLGVGQRWSRFILCYFLFSSAAWAVTVSPDALNQAYSLLFGLLAIYVHLKKGGYYYLFYSAISLFWKECGVSFLFIVPLLEIVQKRLCLKEFFKDRSHIKKTAKQVGFSLLAVSVYFVLRFVLQGNLHIGSTEGNYKISIFSISTIKNFVMLLVSAATGIDSIALFSANRSVVLFCLTAVLSLAFLIGWLMAVISLWSKKESRFPLVCGALCIVCLILPLSVLGHAGEMHTYPVLFGVALFFGCCFDAAKLSAKKVLVGVLAIFLAFGISSAHKLIAIYDYSQASQRVEQEIAAQYELKSGKVLFVVIDEKKGYSIFEQSGIYGTFYGCSMRPYFAWDTLDHEKHNVQTEEEANQYIQDHQGEFEQIFVVKQDHVKKVK